MPSDAATQRHPLKQFAASLREHGALALLMFLYFFLVITTFWILKPLKKAIFVEFYEARGGLDLLGWHLEAAQAEQIAKVLNMVVAAVAVIVFTLLARRLHREQLTNIFCGFFAVTMVVYAFAIASGGHAVSWTFYLYGDLWTTLMVATFFAFLNDSFKPEAAKRLYSVVVLGGVAGGAFGAGVLRLFIDDLSYDQWMWVCLGTTAAIAMVATAAGRIVNRGDGPGARSEAEAKATEESGPQGNAALEGARLVFRSRYLMSIVVVLATYELVSSILDFQFTSAATNYLSGNEIGEFFATTYTITNFVSLFVQIVITTWVMNHFSLTVALLFTPAVILLSSGAFLVVPALWLGGALSVSDNAFNYSINQSARETLYTPTTRDEKYKAKAFIDMFMQRFAKVVAVGLNLVVTMVLATSFFGVRLLSVFSIVLLVVWIAAARYAGKHFERLTAADPDPADARARALS
jgi:ATP:ADP antiporter, AAA family